MSTTRSANLPADSATRPASPVFTFGTQVIPRTRRGWERAPASPRRGHRKGTKVWRRQAQPTQETDALASAQLLGDLAASVSSHAAKRQRVEHMPAIPAAMQTHPTYASTLSDSKSPTKRKVAKRRMSTRSPVEATQAMTSKSPVKRDGKRRRSSIKATSPMKYDPINEATQDPPAPEAAESVSQSGDDFGNEVSFLETVNLAGSTMFDQDPADAKDVEVHSDGDTSTVDLDSGDEEDREEGSSLEEQSELVDDENGHGARLLNAGHTGVVEMACLDDESLEDSVNEEFLNSGARELDLQQSVSELLTTPPKEQALQDDERSGAAFTDTDTESGKSNDLSSLMMQRSPRASFQREETGSTLEFDEAFYQPTVMEVTKDHVFRSPEITESLVQTQPESSAELLSSVAADVIADDAVVPVPIKDDNDVRSTEQSHTSPQPDRSDEQVNTLAAEVSDNESEDEQFTGDLTIGSVVFSPIKQAAAALSRSPSPRKSRSAPRLSDDTTYLTDFLSRVKAQAAAKSQEVNASPVKAPLLITSPRKALEPLEANSSTLSPVRRRTSKDNGSPVRIPRTPTAKMLLENTTSPDTPDELGAPADEADGPRRSGRPRPLAPTKLTASAPNAISLRRADGEPVLLQRSDAQKLAMATRANTRRNKGAAVMPRSVLEELGNKELSPIKQRQAGQNKKGQNVDWDNNLVYFLEDNKTRSKRKAKDMTEEGADSVGNKENSDPAGGTLMPKRKVARVSRTPQSTKTSAMTTDATEEEDPKLAKDEASTPAPRPRKSRPSAIPTRSTPAAKKVIPPRNDEPVPGNLSAPRRRIVRRV